LASPFFSQTNNQKSCAKVENIFLKNNKNCGNLYANEEEKKEEEGAVGMAGASSPFVLSVMFLSVRPPDKHGASLREPPPVTFSFFALFLLCPRVYSRELHDGFDINSCKRRSLFIQRCSATEGGGWPIHRRRKKFPLLFFTVTKKKLTTNK
jgi:hypothetical protein